MDACGCSQKALATEKNSKGFRITVFAGPTGGHLFPAQSFAEGFRKQFLDSRIDLVTSHRAKALMQAWPAGIFKEVHFLPEFGFPNQLSWKALKPFFLAPFLFLWAFFYLRKWKPHLCVGFASFVSYPGMRMAHLLEIPTLVHEQNKMPGKATCWLAPHMDAVAESFEGTRFPKNLKRIFTLGLPLRSCITSAVATPLPHQRPGRPFTILVIGGSQGATGLNAIVMGAMKNFSREERSKIAVIHIAGKQDCSQVCERYKQLSISNQVYPFYSAMGELFQKVDLAVTRAGANTLFELAFFGIPAFVIPYPHAGGHQKYNAEGFAEQGGLLYHEENADAKEWLVKQFRTVWEKPEILAAMAIAMKKIAKPQATEDLVALAQKLIVKYENHS